MKKILIALAACAAFFSTGASAQGIYAGVGLPGLYNLGYSHSFGARFGARLEHSGGLKYETEGVEEGVNVKATLKAASTGAFADWYPGGGGFRLVAGVTVNDISVDMNALGSGTATINDKSVDMTGEYYNVRVKFPDTTPYLGIGYGHHQQQKGLGFYFDLGVKIGKFKVESDTSLVTSGKVTQADIDAQDAKLRDSVDGLSVLPVFQVGMNYRF